jgi:murein DD-endopeptidase MepM/ murein hydrolase activator NlpD
MFAVAGTIAASLVLPDGQAVFADTGVETPAATEATGLSISVETVDQLTGLTAVVETSEPSVPLLAEASPNADVLTDVADGTEVALRVDVVDTVSAGDGTRYWPVAVGGQDGWIDGQYLTQATTAEGDIVSDSLVAYEHTREATAHSTAQVFGNGQNVNVRAEPTSTSDVVTKALDGEVISLRIDMVDTVVDSQGTRWWPVTVNGIEGWISGFYLTDSGDAPTSRPNETPSTVVATSTADATDAPATTEDGSAGFVEGDFAQVFTGDGDSVNVRASGSPDAEIVGQLADGEVVRIVSGPLPADGSVAGWYEVTNANATGFVDGDFLVGSVEAPATSEATATEPPRSEEEEATVQATQTPAASTQAPETAEAETPAATEAPSSGTSEFIYPLANYTRTQGFGCSSLGFYSYNAEYGCPLHNGLDLAAPSGTAIMASAGGTVITAGWCNCGLGYYVEIDHGGGVHTIYGHMASLPYVKAGQTVNQGDVIGPVGSTGISTGPHTHFMVTVNGAAKNPENYLP